MQQPGANDLGGPPAGRRPKPVGVTGQRLCVAIVAFVLGAVAVMVMLSSCWYLEPAPRMSHIPRTPPPKDFRTVVPVRLAAGKLRMVVSASCIGSWKGIAPEDWKLPGRKGRWDVAAIGKLLKIDGRIVPASAGRFTTEDATFRLGGSRYRGDLLVEAKPKKGLTATNLLGLEDYLRSVVGSEMPSRWPLHALMAQAVAARTFALYRLHATGHSRSYLTRADMAYRGLVEESANTGRAVELTAGVVLIYKGSLFPSYFSNTCGGGTSSSARVFEEPAPPPLSGARCRWCGGSRYFKWTAGLTPSGLAAKLSKWGVAHVRSIKLVERDAAGRPLHVVINGVKKIPANDFRLAVGPGVLKSTAFTVTKRRGKFEFAGKGWGHGVGMCQWGARGMARDGKSWEDILKHYYPGAKLARINKD